MKLLSEGESATGRLKAARQKLLGFLKSSTYYRAPELLSRVHDTELHRECAVLYGRVSGLSKTAHLVRHSRCTVYIHVYSVYVLCDSVLMLYKCMQYTHCQMEEHEKALNLLAHKLKDYNAAVEYCRTHSQVATHSYTCLLYTSPSPRDATLSRMPSSA